ncbi:MAG: helix-turn-helix transcriptional regulator [Gemmatimonadota bacterium]
MPPTPELPLSPLTMSILLALAGGDKHGYALMQEIDEQTEGALRPGTGSLYAALQRLLDEGLITDSAKARPAGEDARRKTFRITPAGRAAARAEVARMVRVLEHARTTSLVRHLPLLEDGR